MRSRRSAWHGGSHAPEHPLSRPPGRRGRGGAGGVAAGLGKARGRAARRGAGPRGSEGRGGGGHAEGRVTRVVDGDTIHVWTGGHDEAVRYIGVDTPESV